MAGSGFHYARTKVALWAMFGPALPLFFGAIALLTGLGAGESVVALVAIPLMAGWVFAAARFATVPVDVSLTRSCLRIRALRGWHPYRELDIDAEWPRIRSVLFGPNEPSAPKSWLLIRLGEPTLTFSLAGATEEVRALEESILDAMPEQDDDAAQRLSAFVSGRGFWTSRAATFITLGFAALWAAITGAGAMQMLGWMETDRPFPWLIWLVLTALCFMWIRLFLSARKPE